MLVQAGSPGRTNEAWLQQELTQAHTEVTVYTVYTEPGAQTGLTSPTNRVSLQNRDNLAPP